MGLLYKALAHRKKKQAIYLTTPRTYKVSIKFTTEQAMKIERGSRGIALLFL